MTRLQTRALPALALGLALAAHAPTASAAPNDPPAQDDAATRDAKARFEEGLKRYEQQDYEGARVAFQQAYSVLHAVDILYNLALSELRSNRPVEALNHLQEYLKDKRPTEEERAKASKYLAEAHAKTGHVFVDAPAGAAVLMDDVNLDKKAPVKDPVTVSAGKHVCSIRLDGKTQTVEVVANPGQSVTVRFTGSGEKAPEVLEGQQARANGDGPAPPPASGGWGTGKTVTVVALGVGAVGAVVAGVVFKLGQDSAQSDAQSISSANPGLNCPANPNAAACSQLSDKKSTYDSDRMLSVVMFGVGGALAASAVASAIFWPNENAQPQKGSRLVPVVTAGGMSLQWVGRF
jgi:tetratricopeptide (TPR) repeat protein